MARTRASAARKRRRKGLAPVDVEALLKEHLRVSKDGRSQRMTAFEVNVRTLVKKALKDRNLSAIASVLAVARAYKLLTPPEPPTRGGVLIVPGRLTKESWAALFKKPDQGDGSDNR